MKRGGVNIVETKHRNVFGDAPAGFLQRSDRADGGNIVKGEKRGERLFMRQNFLRRNVTDFRRRNIAFKLRD